MHELKRYEIVGVVGPDEYHTRYPGAEKPGLKNNAYTNLMAVWVLTHTLELFDLLPEDRSRELLESLDLSKAELEQWREISHKMFVPFHGGRHHQPISGLRGPGRIRLGRLPEKI